MRKSESETTDTLPPRLPHAAADCFDLDFCALPKVVAHPSAVFLDFAEFQGLAPRVPLHVRLEFSNGICALEHTELGVYGRGETCEAAVVDFLEYLVSDYRAYAEEADENLDSHARALAGRYRELLRRL